MEPVCPLVELQKLLKILDLEFQLYGLLKYYQVVPRVARNNKVAFSVLYPIVFDFVSNPGCEGGVLKLMKNG